MIAYLDANIFIFAALDSGGKGEKARKIIKDILNGAEHGVTCSLTIDEVIWKIWRESKDRSIAIEQGFRILAMPNLKVTEVAASTMLQAMTLLQAYPKLKPRDAIHAASCLSDGVFSIISDDGDFDEIQELHRIPIL